jgi:hypothetical protein
MIPLTTIGESNMTDKQRALEAITAVRHRAAASFDEGFTGVRGQAYDRAVLDCYDAVRALEPLTPRPQTQDGASHARGVLITGNITGYCYVCRQHVAETHLCPGFTRHGDGSISLHRPQDGASQEDVR